MGSCVRSWPLRSSNQVELRRSFGQSISARATALCADARRLAGHRPVLPVQHRRRPVKYTRAAPVKTQRSTFLWEGNVPWCWPARRWWRPLAADTPLVVTGLVAPERDRGELACGGTCRERDAHRVFLRPLWRRSGVHDRHRFAEIRYAARRPPSCAVPLHLPGLLINCIISAGSTWLWRRSCSWCWVSKGGPCGSWSHDSSRPRSRRSRDCGACW